VAVANGLPYGPPYDPPLNSQFWNAYAQCNHLFVNDGQGRFQERSALEPALCGQAAVWRGLICGDINGDGALDLLATATGGRARLFRNVAPHRGHWLLVNAADPAHGGRPAYGAEIRVEAGGRRWLGWISPSFGYCSSNDHRAHFGLGAVEQVDAIWVRWPDGGDEIFPGVRTDQVLQLVKGTGRPASAAGP